MKRYGLLAALGVLACAQQPTAEDMPQEMVWVDRSGRILGRLGAEQQSIFFPEISPDGRFIAVSARDGEVNDRDIWIHDAAAGTKRRAAGAKGNDNFPIWSPDGKRIAFTSSRSGNYDLYVKSIDPEGPETAMVATEQPEFPRHWSPDGRGITFTRAGTAARGLFLVSVEDRKVTDVLVKPPAWYDGARFSPNGKYLAYVSNAAGPWEAYVAGLENPAQAWKVSRELSMGWAGGGGQPRWRADGKELFYVMGNDTMMSVEVSTSGTFTHGAPKRLFARPGMKGNFPEEAPWLARYDVTADGQRFVFVRTVPKAIAEWNRFRGPNGSGVAETSGLPAEFGPAKNVVWKAALPPGHSSPVLSGGRIFLTAFEGQKLLTLCLDQGTGRMLWRRECPRNRAEPLDKRNTPASPTPATDGRNVYVFFPDFGLVSYGSDGNERWRAPLGPFTNVYGMGASPILAGDKVIVVCDQSRNSFAAAFDRDDGRLHWTKARPEALSGHSTPAVYEPGDGPVQILAPGSFRLDAYSADTGESIWWVNGLASEMKSAPVLAGDMVYVSGYNTPENDPGRQIAIPPFDERDSNHDGRISREEATEHAKRYFQFLDLDRDGYLDAGEWKLYRATMAAENGLLAIRLGGRGDSTGASLRWKYQRAVPQLPSTLLYREVLYMISDSGVLTTFNPATGAVHKQARLRGPAGRYFASPVAADGKVFFLSEAGVVTVVKAGPEQEMLAVNELDDECYATPAIAGGRIYIRTRSALYCFGR
ncbi:MAG: PQQ-binding-like beta-propeller repeat protein [Acidobacteria bacterium]|nr:PQQ-binding-like beta-propeller repeat protein [Acidobacteriota bacterium]